MRLDPGRGPGSDLELPLSQAALLRERRRGNGREGQRTLDERWSMHGWLSGKAAGTLAEALGAPLAAGYSGMEFEFVQVLGQQGEGAKEVVLDLLRKGNVLEKLGDVIVGLAKELAQADAATGSEMSSKFASLADSFELSYGSQCDFFAGLEDLIGPPDPRVEEAMKKEHCVAKDSQTYWTTQNYGVETTPEIRGNDRGGWLGGGSIDPQSTIHLRSGPDSPTPPRSVRFRSRCPIADQSATYRRLQVDASPR